MNKYLVFFSYLLLPCIVFGLGFHLEITFNPIFLLALYMVTIAGIILFCFLKFYRYRLYMLALLLGLVISPFFAFVAEARTYHLDVIVLDGPWLPFHFFVSSLTLYFYIIPFIMISLAVIVIMKATDKRKELQDESEMSKKNTDKSKAIDQHKKKSNKRKGNKKR